MAVLVIGTCGTGNHHYVDYYQDRILNVKEERNVEHSTLPYIQVNMIRIYNPVKNSIEHDKKGEFIKKWVPELKNLPERLVHMPWEINLFEKEEYNFQIGINYPERVVDISKTYLNASKLLWAMRKDEDVKKESKRVLDRHTNPNRKAFMD